MTQKQIHVGIVGANAQRSWANVSHVPAINGLSGLRLAAVATRNEQSARKAAEAFGADRWFSDPLAMIGDDEVDVITISVNVPAHRELVLAALSAGKAVYCEAPLGRTVAEAEEMVTGVGSLHTAIGLQGRLNPAVRRAAQLLSSGKIGRPLNARIVSATTGFGPEVHSSHDLFNKMRLVSLEIPEPRATGYQNLMRQNSKLTRRRLTKSTPRLKYHSRIAGSTSGAGRRARRPVQGSAFLDANLDEERITSGLPVVHSEFQTAGILQSTV